MSLVLVFVFVDASGNDDDDDDNRARAGSVFTGETRFEGGAAIKISSMEAALHWLLLRAALALPRFQGGIALGSRATDRLDVRDAAGWGAASEAGISADSGAPAVGIGAGVAIDVDVDADR